MSNFNKLVSQILSEAGGNMASTVMGGPNGQPAGSTGNQFPADNDKGYNENDARIATLVGAKIVKPGKGKGKSKTKPKVKVPIQRRSIYLPGM
jgi:hypothetical protein